MRFLRIALALLASALLAGGCVSEDAKAAITHPTAVTGSPSPIATMTATTTPTSTSTPTVTPSPTPSPTPTQIPVPTPYGCLRPPDDYTQVVERGEYIVNQRTLAMLEHAQELYGGSHDLVKAITQGSYHPGMEASFGTHDGGGVVDLAVRDLEDWHHILYEDMDAIILALRRAGFAAWLREQDSLYEGSPIHIHAVAVGDVELSEAAERQLAGPEGYFRGYDGLPVDPPQPDPHGGPIVCPWMEAMGYRDLRLAAAPTATGSD
jgi:hypothetical protein